MPHFLSITARKKPNFSLNISILACVGNVTYSNGVDQLAVENF
jgi:hypothetical protein